MKKYRIVERDYGKPSTATLNQISVTLNPVRYIIQQWKGRKWIDLPDMPFVEVSFRDYPTAKYNLNLLLKKNKKPKYKEKVMYSRKEKLAKLLGKRV